VKKTESVYFGWPYTLNCKISYEPIKSGDICVIRDMIQNKVLLNETKGNSTNNMPGYWINNVNSSTSLEYSIKIQV